MRQDARCPPGGGEAGIVDRRAQDYFGTEQPVLTLIPRFGGHQPERALDDAGGPGGSEREGARHDHRLSATGGVGYQ